MKSNSIQRVCQRCGQPFLVQPSRLAMGRGLFCSRQCLYPDTTTDRFWARIDKGDGCWTWTGGRMPTGYGSVRFRGECTVAHRVVWELTHGPIPSGIYVCHTCDNRLCCNPGHLFLGTHLDNIADMVAKGRNAKGETNGQAKLTEADVLAIRTRVAAGKRQLDVARSYALDSGHVSMIVHRKIWKHLNAPSLEPL